MTLPQETPVALTYHGTTMAVMMATPEDLEDFALGFSLSEGLVSGASGIVDLLQVDGPKGIELQITLSDADAPALAARQRRVFGAVGCGLCGIDQIAQAVPELPVLEHPTTLTPQQIEAALAALSSMQVLRARTGAVHGAGLFDPEGGMLLVREDIGRHNAVDKLIGAAMRAGYPIQGRALVVSCRVSLEIVQKAVRAGFGALVAVSTPTSLAVEQAGHARLPLYARAKSGELVAYRQEEKTDG